MMVMMKPNHYIDIKTEFHHFTSKRKTTNHIFSICLGNMLVTTTIVTIIKNNKDIKSYPICAVTGFLGNYNRFL